MKKEQKYYKMNILKIDRGNVAIFDARSGTHIRTIMQFGDAVSAEFNSAPSPRPSEFVIRK